MAIQTERREWVDDPVAVKTIVVDFYSRMFKADANISGDFILDHFPPVPEEYQRNLVAEFSNKETRTALMS